jgi:hypothetical protein
LPAPPEGERYLLRAVSGGRGEGVTVGEVDAGVPAQRVFTVPLNAGEKFEFEIVLGAGDGKEGRAVFVPVRT